MIEGSSEEAMVRPFAGAQREGIGRFGFDPATGCWSWADAVFDVLGLRRGSCVPSWSWIVEHIPEEERADVEAAFQQACQRTGPFSWSHRVNAEDGRVRSVLVLGQTSRPGTTATPAEAASEDVVASPVGLQLDGYVIDLTELRLDGARAAATEAVAASRAHQSVIEQAKGALMLAYRIDADTAFALLAWHSQQRNVKLHAIAADLVEQLAADRLGDCNQRTIIDRLLAGQPPTTPSSPLLKQASIG